MSQFAVSERINALRSRTREFIDQNVLPLEPMLLEEETPLSARTLRQLQAQAKEAGLWALGLPADIGGGGLQFMEYVYINEVIGRSEAAMFALGTHQTQDALMLHQFCSESQKAKWLRPLVDGEIWPSVAMTEPDAAGSDPTLIATQATPDGGEWVLNGHKWFVTGADQAAFTTVFCVTDPDAPPHQRASMIIVPTDADGFQIVRPIKTMGHIGGHHCEILLKNVRVPRDNLLGSQGQGFRIAQARLGPGRIFHAMRWLGQASRAFDLMCARALTRYAHGSLLADKQMIQAFIADSATEIQAARLLTLNAAAKLDRGEDARMEIAQVKFFGARVLHQVIDRAIQVHGALGLSDDTPLERMYRDARYARIYDGPDEVHKVTVARQILKRYQSGSGWDPGA